VYDNHKSCSNSSAPRTKSCGAVDTYFKNNLSNSAIRCYNKYFSNSANANNVIVRYDIFNQLTGNNGQSIKLFDLSVDVQILFPETEVL